MTKSKILIGFNKMTLRNGFVSNSSSESFICTTIDSILTATAKLQQLLDFYNSWEGRNYKFDDVFVVQKITKELIKSLKDFDFTVPKNATLAINSAEENSIPYELYELIESKFNAHRIHMG